MSNTRAFLIGAKKTGPTSETSIDFQDAALRIDQARKVLR